MPSTVLVTVSGDAGTAKVRADVSIPLTRLLPTWAKRCSSSAPEDLAIVFGDEGRSLDLNGTLDDLGMPSGSILHLVAVVDLDELDGVDLDRVDLDTVEPPVVQRSTTTMTAGAVAMSAGPPGMHDDPELAPSMWGLRSVPSPTIGLQSALRWPTETFTPPTSPVEPARPPSASTSSPARVLDRPVVTPVPSAPRSRRARPEDAALPPRVPGLKRFWRAVKAVLSRKMVSLEPAGAFAMPTRLTAGQRYRMALQATNRSHNLEVMIRANPLRRCMVIAVVSPKGGPGKTTVTALLGSLFAELRRDPVLALDANPDLGDLKDKLGHNGNGAAALVDDLAAWLDEHPSATPADMWSRLGVGPHGLRYIATPRPPECSRARMIAAADFQLYQGLIARLRDYAGIILIDCGTGMLDPPVRAALQAADQIVLVTDGAATTARQVVAATELLPEHVPTWLVANKMPKKGSSLDLGLVAAAIPRLNGVAVLPVPDGGQLAENIVTPGFRWSEAPDAWQEPIRELGARLARNWRAPRG
jgi:MinD-like ATPase involved in chromosome partitioning or flagellar assembly